MTFDELVARATALASTGGRRVLGICGAPGAGKSTLAERLAAALPDLSVLVGMDGFHYAQRELERLGRTDRKGAIDTFDGEGYLDLLSRIKDGFGESSSTVYAPEFRRDLEEPIACAIPVFPTVPLVITEGNYLLVDRSPWRDIREILDEVWFIAPPDTVRLDRLVKRHERFGRTHEEARARSYGSDQTNADLIIPTAERADLVIGEIT